MTGFSAQWLSLREGADHRSRHAGLAKQLTQHFAGRELVRVVDLGSGTGSNLRATAPRLGPAQEWVLIDNDPALLEEAALALTHWADHAKPVGDALVLVKDGANIGVSFRLHDLAGDIEGALSGQPDLITASALFDLASAGWMGRLARAIAGRKAAFYTVLTYDGRDSFTPENPLDAAVMAAFSNHMQSEKGFGIAAGPKAAAALAESFAQVGYRVETGDSPWVLDAQDRPLADALVNGIAGAVSETGALAPADLEAWLAFRTQRSGNADARLITGHTDILAYAV
jgi:hypothetical protein